MTSPFLTGNILCINICVLLLTTSLVGGAITVIWLGIGRLLENAGFVNIVFELLKMAVFFFCCPLVYILLKVFELRLGKGYLFLPTEVILRGVKAFLVFWGMGTLFMLVYIIHDVLKLKKKYSDMFTCDNKVQDIFKTVQEDLHLTTKYKYNRLQLRQSYRAQVPCIIGILHPTVVLPVENYSPNELTYILMHEVMHYKQRDILWKRLMLLVCAINFYNPLAWLLLVEIQKWSEYACDYKVCKHEGKVHEYFEVLMSIAVGKGGQSQLASQLIENRHELVERAKKMKKVYKKTRSKISMIIILSIAFVLSSMTVCAATLESAGHYVRLNQYTSVDINVGENVQYEEYIEQGDEENIFVVPGKIDDALRSRNTFNWRVNSKTKVHGPYFECLTGDVVTVIANVVPSNVSVKIGIEDSSGTKRYINGSGSVNYAFEINDDDDYFFFVENISDTSVTVTGSYITP